MVKSASENGSGVFSQGILLLGRLDFALVTSPSLSSLKLVMYSLGFLVLVEVAFASCLRATGFGFAAGFATRVVDGATLALGGRGILLYGY